MLRILQEEIFGCKTIDSIHNGQRSEAELDYTFKNTDNNMI